jgi:hypothetical protein
MMVCVTDLAPGEVGPPVGSVHELKSIAAVRMDGWLRLCFEGEDGLTVGGIGGVWCRVRTVEVRGRRGRLVTTAHSGWGPESP